ncbi:sigma-70 family RNA polymerase sigma factor [Fulvivirgaceae bacterium PWU5]|uniref:Sigma-70 family RNA polymerase sigma factor n=1 Tax=Dawidia cretensis TaxID=2782350 RepID=A0AAP2E2M8_9BACT|nr:sigma-70 family RNA polymerase sigma factor [Dawidia cretensis]MBT1711856.1 sigma-70 family RNA polymerase sigma factor [Dawidia cretensis]
MGQIQPPLEKNSRSCDNSSKHATNDRKIIVQMELKQQNFIRIIRENQGIIKSLCKAYYARYEDQRDAYQDIILQLWKSFDTFRGESKISTWIYSVSLNTLLTKVRNERNKIITEPLLLPDLINPPAMADDDRELLGIVIQSLKDVDKAIVILSLEGYQNKEISLMLDLTPTNVSTRLNRITTELKVKLKNHRHESKQS